MSVEKDNLGEAVLKMRSARNELVLAAILLDQAGNFKTTILEIKSTVGDISVAIGLIDIALGI